ncbi:PREDICTED: elongation of very long chain fatty acids protein 4-like isoform X2 [Eufriesea mexicana]|uniref:elongation of very long chain fatty acids protein 4-like isoform X2 n=1 Tax=Eufriesea mexicana TaxID=516756 RepID=UPI00083C25F7|nr:PREDICTED: elongation of very long chain fatty acids protein 4-like isoform X2 [Eufriesea mexicana]
MTILMERIGLTTKDLMIIKTPIPLIVLSIIYLYFVLKAGPNYMKDRKPYSLARFIQLYNIFQIMTDNLELSIMYLKAFDYIETVLFVLRKKQRQISFLHLYHHITTVHFSWLMIKYYIPGIYLLFGMINCSVHVMMYTYYFFSSFGPSIQKILNPIKPIITTIQMVSRQV